MNIIIKPLTTEKMTAQGAETLNNYAFIVDRGANKIMIKKEVERIYGVTVSKIRTMNYEGKRLSRQTKSGMIKGQKNNFKKAIVTLPKSEEIDFYASV